MRKPLGISAALALCGLLALFAQPVDAASLRVCAPSSAGAALGPAQVAAPTSGNLYSINARGCVVIPSSDLGDLQAKGFIVDASLQSMVVVSGVLTSTTSVQVASLPASAYISNILVQNTTANAVTGGIDIGKTTGAADIVSAKVCAANCLTHVLDSAVLLRVFSTTAAQPIWVTGHTDGNSANLTITILYGYF
jgi:hypothetical protein